MEHPENSEEYKGLTVNKGIEQPSIVNPYLKLRKKPRRREFSVGEYVEGIVKGDVTVLSQAVTLVPEILCESVSVVCLVPARVHLLMYLDCMCLRREEN